MIENSQSSFNLWKLFLVIAHRRKFIISFVLICTIGAIITSLVLPKWYRSKASILPSQHDQAIGLTGNFAQYSVSSAGFELPIMATPSDVYATMLKSETIARSVDEAFGLQEYYDLESFHECLYYLKDKVSIEVTPEGVVELYYEDKSPEMAANIANRYIEELDRLNRNVKAAKAKSDREFIYHRLDSTKTLLDSARGNLLAFQKKYKAIDLESQKELAITSASELKTELALTQVSLVVQKKTYSDNHPSVIGLANKVEELQKQMSILEIGNGSNSYLTLPLSDIPELSSKLAELWTRVELQEKVHLLLTELYEEARIREQKDTPTIAILETAYPPQIKHRPKRIVIVVFTFSLSILLAVFISLFADYLENLRRTSPSDFELLKQAKNEMSGKSGYSDS